MNRIPPLRQDRERRGYTLIELLVVISISAAATAGSLVCISAILRAERNTAVAVQECQVVARLRLMWNEDVHLAKAWSAGSGEQKSGTQCDLVLQDGRKVRYHPSDRGLMREVQGNGGREERDVFQFPEGTRFQFFNVEEHRLARLKVIRPAADSSAIVGHASDSSPSVLGSVVMTFDAAPGREARLLEDLQTQSKAN